MPTHGHYWANMESNIRNYVSAFPNLFPNSLEQMCTNCILEHLVRCGKEIENSAKQITATSELQHFDESYQYLYWKHNFAKTLNTHYYTQIPSRRNSNSFSSSDLHEFLSNPNRSTKFLFTKSKYFIDCVNVTRRFLTSFLASSLLDRLTDAARRQGNAAQDGHFFCFSVLCNDRLARLVVCLHKEIESVRSQNDTMDNTTTDYLEGEEKEQDWSKFMVNGIGSDLFLACLCQLTGLSSLTIQDVATNEMLYVIADTCHRLIILDISHSTQVSELGLVYLCGKTNQSISSTSSLYLNYETIHPLAGCKYLRELHFNPRKSKSPPPTTTTISSKVTLIMPRVIAYMFRHLTHLQVVNMENLFDGIRYYYFGVPGDYHPRPDRIAPLNLVHYIGQDDQLTNIAGICPKLRAFKIKVTTDDALTKLGLALSEDFGSMSLEHFTLVYDKRHRLLTGFNDFISKCGHRINSLEISTQATVPDVNGSEDEIEDLCAKVSLENLKNISHHCKLLESLSFDKFKMAALEEATPVSSVPLEFRFLVSLQLRNIHMTQCPKEIFKHILGNSPDLERLQIDFETTSFFFNDFLLDDILSLNPLGRLEEFVLENSALTLISALRLLSSRPKLKSMGNLLTWDVEPSELETFEQILRKAKGLGLLQHDIKVY